MSTNSLAMVNQKLAYYRAVIALLEKLPPASNASERMQHQSLMDAGTFHLWCAYQHYLRELGENYMLPQVASIRNEDDLEQALAAQGKHPSEVQELQELRRRSDSWLARLVASCSDCWQMGVPASEHSGRIQAVDLNAPAKAETVTASRLKEWYRSLKALIDRQRESSVEW